MPRRDAELLMRHAADYYAAAIDFAILSPHIFVTPYARDAMLRLLPPCY